MSTREHELSGKFFLEEDVSHLKRFIHIPMSTYYNAISSTQLGEPTMHSSALLNDVPSWEELARRAGIDVNSLSQSSL
jgi:hypothetical protein